VDQRSFFNAVLRSVSTRYLHTSGSIDGKDSAFDNKAIPGVAAMIAGLVKDNLYLEECLIEWLTATSSDASTFPLGTRRAGMAALAVDESKTSPRSLRFKRIFFVVATAKDTSNPVLLRPLIHLGASIY
jgi:hypothetical protein